MLLNSVLLVFLDNLKRLIQRLASSLFFDIF